MKVLFVIHYPFFGGPHNQALRLNKLLFHSGWQSLVLLPQEDGNAAERLIAGKVEVLTIPLHRLRARLSFRAQTVFAVQFWPEVLAIRRIIRDQQIDLLMIGGLVNPHAAIAGRMEQVPVVWQILDTRTPTLLRKILMPVVKGLADVVMCTGMRVARAHPGAMGLGRRLVPFIPPVDTVDFRPDPARRVEARTELGVPERGFLIGAVGNLNPQKGHEYLIEAGAIVQRDIPELWIRILGGIASTHVDYLESLNEKAKVLGLTRNNRFRFTDPGEHVGEWLPAYDVFLLTSVPRSEGIPTVILEAMACGLPVVTTDVGSVREIVEDGVTGFVVAPMDSQAIAACVLRLLNDEELRRNMGERARRCAVEQYDARFCAQTHVKAFEIALAHREKIQQQK